MLVWSSPTHIDMHNSSLVAHTTHTTHSFWKMTDFIYSPWVNKLPSIWHDKPSVLLKHLTSIMHKFQPCMHISYVTIYWSFIWLFTICEQTNAVQLQPNKFNWLEYDLGSSIVFLKYALFIALPINRWLFWGNVRDDATQESPHFPSDINFGIIYRIEKRSCSKRAICTITGYSRLMMQWNIDFVARSTRL